MNRQTKIAVKDASAAKMLDLQTSEFRQLVNDGILPPPVRLGRHERWRVADLEAIKSGERIDKDFEW